jgi:hypothetical protein
MFPLRLPLLMLGAITLLSHSPLELQAQPSSQELLRFKPAGPNEFTFDTGVLRGKLRAEGKSRGLSSVVHLPTGITLDRSMGLFGHYRVFSANRRYGTAAWDWPGEGTLAADGSVTTRWPATAERPFDLEAVYRWAAPNLLDLETTVTAKTNLTQFESFLAAYFSEGFTNSQAYAAPSAGNSKAAFVTADKSFGTWLAFPRDAAAIDMIRDGRWKLAPNPVDWVIMPRLAQPLSLRRCPANGLTAVLMAPAKDCFAISTPEQTEAHYSMYLSLFGMDLKAGQKATAHSRLLIATGLSDADILKAYESWAK